jgi:hypothetical protein
MGYGYRYFDGDFAANSYVILYNEYPAGTATNGSLTGETTAATLGAREAFAFVYSAIAALSSRMGSVYIYIRTEN